MVAVVITHNSYHYSNHYFMYNVHFPCAQVSYILITNTPFFLGSSGCFLFLPHSILLQLCPLQGDTPPHLQVKVRHLEVVNESACKRGLGGLGGDNDAVTRVGAPLDEQITGETTLQVRDTGQDSLEMGIEFWRQE